MKIKVSVIVPVYNSEVFISRCLDSLVNQTLREIEIICINDCSTDLSLDILKKYKEKFNNRIVIIDLDKNSGPGGARNKGIEKASGEYIGFVDSDDYVEPEMFEDMYKIANKGNYDLVDCGYINNHVSKNVLNIRPCTWGELTVEKRKNLVANPGYMWSKIIKKNIFVDNNLKFREDITFEDVDFSRIICMYVNRVYGTDNIYYHYENRLDSITNSTRIISKAEARKKAIESLCNKFKEMNLYEIYKDELNFVIYVTYAEILMEYGMTLDPKEQSYDFYNNFRNFFFEHVKDDYADNKYIKMVSEKEYTVFAELNNLDYRLILDTLVKN